jgi:hypothetical protein
MRPFSFYYFENSPAIHSRKVAIFLISGTKRVFLPNIFLSPVQNSRALFALAHFSEKFSFAVTTSIIVELPWGNQAETAVFTAFSFD